MRHIILLFLPGLIAFGTIAQTCTSSGGDQDPDDFEPYRFRCGGSRKWDKDRKKEKGPVYESVESCGFMSAEGYYYTWKNKVYYSYDYVSFDPVLKADVKTFHCENGTAMDKDHIFFKGKAVASIETDDYEAIGYYYVKLNDKIYSRNKLPESSGLKEVETNGEFKLIGDSLSLFAKDEDQVFYNGLAIKDSDPKSFQILNNVYTKDDKNVYFNGSKKDSLVGKSFEIIDEYGIFGKDENFLCYYGNVIPNSDAKTFKDLGCGYFSDKNNVYLNGRVLPGIDSETFELLSWGYTKDKNKVYCDQQVIVGANPATFQVLARKHSKDDRNVFFLQKIIDCDYASFKVSDKLDYMASDKDFQYKSGVRLPK
ncbi:MAG: DKNYY domain-containing protein, partial [Flavobacteriales bacterium]|nr:DKNYY domain-containing protein [Flavobacteriales bacterium]